jgi:PBP1b-binding outer membrane lipoprotein LpoB
MSNISKPALTKALLLLLGIVLLNSCGESPKPTPSKSIQEIKNNTVVGVIWSDIQAISGYKRGDKYSFPESDLIDWTITRADGSEEGNFVGKFLETYQPH